jgi:hypothetical protein
MLFVGIVAAVVGVFWALQGAGIVQWPASSFKLSNQSWVLYGGALAIIGIGLIVASRR